MSEEAPAASKKEVIPDIVASKYFDTLYKIISDARSLNCQFSTPEVVVIGKSKSEKTSLLEGFMGHRVAEFESANRPLELHLLYNPNFDSVNISIQRDGYFQDRFPDDEQVDIMSDLPSKIKERQTEKAVKEPIRVFFEGRSFWNMVLIDTPGLLPVSGETAEEAASREKIVLDLCRPRNRFIVAVEEACEWDVVESVSFVRRVDPLLQRSMFVFSKISAFMGTFSSPADASAYFQGSSQLPLFTRGKVSPNVFFTNFLSGARRHEKANIFKKNIPRDLENTLALAQSLQVDSRLLSHFGIAAYSRRIYEAVWSEYRHSIIPEISKCARRNLTAAISAYSEAEKDSKSFGCGVLRQKAFLLASSWASAVSAVLSGSLSGRPGLTGQTREDEIEALGGFDWAVPAGSDPIRLDLETIPDCGSLFYGSQQLERLFAEFREVVKAAELQEDGSESKAESASDVALRCKQLFPGLVALLVQRIEEICFHAREAAAEVGPAAKDLSAIPRLAGTVLGAYNTAVGDLMKRITCAANEIVPNGVLLGYKFAKDPNLNAESLFANEKGRFADRVILASYELVIGRFAEELPKIIIGKVAELSDEELAVLFESDTEKKTRDKKLARANRDKVDAETYYKEINEAAEIFAHAMDAEQGDDGDKQK